MANGEFEGGKEKRPGGGAVNDAIRLRRRGEREKQKQRLLRALTKREIWTINKDNPFLRERNALIYELRKRGVKCYLLEDISGIPKSIIHRIGFVGPNYGLIKKRKGQVNQLKI